jgi:hypothetical protein
VVVALSKVEMTRLNWIVLAVLSCVVSVGLGVGVTACDPVKGEVGPDGGGGADGPLAGDDAALPDSGGGPCTSSAQCSAPLGVCAPDGVCVACAASSDCPLDTASVCDQGSRSCRACAADNECPGGGVCVETEGRCVASDMAAYVTMGGNDTGTCTRAAPCQSIAYAVRNLNGRKTIHVLGGSLTSNAGTTLADVGTLVIDGEDTTLTVFGTVAPFAITGSSDVTLEGFRLAVPTASPTGAPSPAIAVTGPAKAILDDLTIEGAGGPAIAAAQSAQVTLSHSHVGNLSTSSSFAITCPNSRLTAIANTFEMTILGAFSGNCTMTVQKNRFESIHDGSVQANGGQLIMENNLVIHREGFNDSILATNLSPGSTIRYNTITNTTATSSDGAALACDNTVQVTSNIFAYNSGHPITGQGCTTRYSVFDDVAQTSAGTGNRVTGIETIFVDRAGGNYHLATDSVARAHAEPGLDMVTEDFEGRPRPSPAGTNADCGAFEAP